MHQSGPSHGDALSLPRPADPVLISTALQAQGSRPHCEIKICENAVKIFLEAVEAVGEGFKPGTAKNQLKLLG